MKIEQIETWMCEHIYICSILGTLYMYMRLRVSAMNIAAYNEFEPTYVLINNWQTGETPQ